MTMAADAILARRWAARFNQRTCHFTSFHLGLKEWISEMTEHGRTFLLYPVFVVLASFGAGGTNFAIISSYDISMTPYCRA